MANSREAEVGPALARVLAGMCPYCEAGPFVIVAAHVSRAHGVGPRQFRDDLGVTYHTPLTSPEDHARLSAASRERAEVKPLPRPPRGTKREPSVRAREVFRRSLARASQAVTPEERREIAAASNRSPRRQVARDEWRAQQSHGTNTKYELGCRCADCRRAATELRARYPRRRPEREPGARQQALDTPCPKCGAEVSRRCVSSQGLPSDIHTARRG